MEPFVVFLASSLTATISIPLHNMEGETFTHRIARSNRFHRRRAFLKMPKNQPLQFSYLHFTSLHLLHLPNVIESIEIVTF
jgi:hypothetical protein